MFDRHTFSTELAAKLGVHTAIVFHYMAYWVYENAINKRNFKDGKYWTYNSIAALQTHFYYMSAKTITRAIEKLVDAGYIESGCYNQDPYDRTKWYTLTDDAMKIYPINDFLNKGRLLRQNDQNDCPKRENPLGQNDLADLDKVTNSNTIITTNYNKEEKENISNNINIIPNIKEKEENPKIADFDNAFYLTAEKIKKDPEVAYNLRNYKVKDIDSLLTAFKKHITKNFRTGDFLKQNYMQNRKWLFNTIGLLDLSEATGVKMGPGEKIGEDGRRYYLQERTGKPIYVPNDAPPRPSTNHVWVQSYNAWIVP